MKILGLIGGISWVSTLDYYKYLNEGVNARLGGMHFCHCIIHSFSYADIIRHSNSGNHETVLDMITQASLNLKQSGAEAIVLCANTMHMHAAALEERVQLPVIHIATATASAIAVQGLNKVALLGTKFTMEKDFFKEKLSAQDITALIPDDANRDFVHATIFDELGKNIIKEETKARYISIINELAAQGAQGVILGCTEIPLLIKPGDISIPTFDTARIHADAAVQFALS